MPFDNIISLSEREILLRATPAFQNLNVNELGQLSSLMQEVLFEPPETVVTEGELIDAIYIIANGTLEVTRQVMAEGKSGSTFLALLNPGESIGLNEEGLFSETGLRTATVKAVTSCVLLKISMRDFDAFLTQHPDALQSMKKARDLVFRMQFIKESNPFMRLSNQRIAWLASLVKCIDVNRGDIIFRQNDPVDNCYMIVEGKVEFIVQAKDGTEKILNILESGQLFGERAIFRTAKRVATARAVTACSLMVLDQDTLAELEEERSAIPDSILSESFEYNRPIRVENIIHHHREMADRTMITVLKDPVRNKYLQLNEEGWYIWQQLNGKLSVQEIGRQFSARFNRFDPQTVIKIIRQLVDEGFANADVMQPDRAAGEEGKNRGRKGLQRFQFIYNMKNSDKKMDKLYRYGGWLFFNIPALVLIALIISAGLFYFPATLNNALHDIRSSGHLLLLFIWIAFASALLRLISPLTKAMSIRHFGHTVPHFSIGWHYIFPVAFVDTSDLWLSSRIPRVITMLSGITSTLLIASLLSLLAWYKPASFMTLTASLCSIVLYFLALRSLDPLLESDGYHALSHALNVSNLRESSLTWLSKNTGVLQRNHRIYFIYYASYILLNFLFIALIQHQLQPYGLALIWNGWMIYLILAAVLLTEFFIEFNQVKKMSQLISLE